MAALSMRELQIFFDRIRSNKVFELFVVALILFSAVLIGVNLVNQKNEPSFDKVGMFSTP